MSPEEKGDYNVNIVVGILIAVCIAKCIAYKAALKAMGIYFEKNGYKQPTDDELNECSRIALKRMFRFWGR